VMLVALHLRRYVPPLALQVYGRVADVTSGSCAWLRSGTVAWAGIHLPAYGSWSDLKLMAIVGRQASKISDSRFSGGAGR
jgi:hypothetical protein